MERLTGADATFLYAQTRNGHMEIASCIVLDPRDIPRGEELLEHTKAYLEPRLHLAPLLRRRLVRVPLELDHPVWIEDPDFDLDYHVRHAALPAPGTRQQLGDLVGRLLSRPLDHSRPLWEMYLIEGLEGDKGAVFLKTHHAAVDGIAGFELMASLIDLAADAPPPAPPDKPWEPDREPSDLELLAGAAMNLSRQPLRGVKAMRRLVRATVQSRRHLGSAAAALGSSGAPPTRFNEPIGPHRRTRFFSLDLDELKAVKSAADAKLNDVVLAVVAGGLRRYLDRHAELPDEPLVAFVPVSLRTEGATGANQTSMIHVGLATDESDPVKRLARIVEASAEAKSAHSEIGPSVFVDVSELSGPAGAALAFRLIERTRLNERTRASGNVVVSNIPGPPFQLYTAGAPIEEIYPVGPLAEGSGLNITLLSYLGRMGFSVVADRERVPDLDDLVDDLIAAHRELRDAVGVSSS
jgi:diacylglycerol O-acyltransferase / wax synthase